MPGRGGGGYHQPEPCEALPREPADAPPASFPRHRKNFMPPEPTDSAAPLRPIERETVSRMGAELVGKTVPPADEAAVVEMLNFLAADMAALKAFDPGEIEPATAYRFER